MTASAADLAGLAAQGLSDFVFVAPFGLSPSSLAFMGAVFFAAAFVRGYSGFGFAAFAISAASLVMDPLKLAPMVLIADILLSAQQWAGIRGQIEWRRVGPLFLGALVGVPVGIHVLSGIGLDAARAVIAVFVLLMCGALLGGWRLHHVVGAPAHVAAGVVSGLANAAAIGGLPVAAFFAAQALSSTAFRATLIAYFTALDLWTIPLMAAQGAVTLETLRVTVLALPVLVFGVWLGTRHFLSTSPAEFRKFAVILLAGLAMLGLARSVA